jgi:hypothetical protein
MNDKQKEPWQMKKESYTLLNLCQYGDLQCGQNLGALSPLQIHFSPSQRRQDKRLDNPSFITMPALCEFASPQSIPLTSIRPIESGNKLKCVCILFNPLRVVSPFICNLISTIINLRLIIVLMSVTQILTSSGNPRHTAGSSTLGATRVLFSWLAGIWFKLMPIYIFCQSKIARGMNRNYGLWTFSGMGQYPFTVNYMHLPSPLPDKITAFKTSARIPVYHINPPEMYYHDNIIMTKPFCQ